MSLAADAGAASRPKQRGWFWSALPSALVAVLVVVLSPALSGGRLRLAPLAVLPDVPPAPAPEKDASCACPAPDSRDAVPFSSDGLSELTGVVRDCCCEYETVDRLNEEVLHPLLSRLVKQPFFRYFKVNLYCDCPFWPDDGMCALPDCSVCECPADEVPLPWRTPTAAADGQPAAVGTASQGDDCSAAEASTEDAAEARLNAREGTVNRTLDVGAEFRAWRELDNPWTADDESEGADARAHGLTYVNLLLNPERYTGYSGEHAHRVWDAIYSQPCFAGVATARGGGGGDDGSCASGAVARPDVRLFYRLISGLHASISTHIAMDYLVDRARGIWGPNLGLWHTRVGAHTDRQESLYMTTLFVLRAVLKAGDFLQAADYRTGSPGEDAITSELVRELVQSPQLRAACPLPFDEARLLQGDEGARHKEELRVHFRNISSVMDCVGCEKCRLWGKLQTLGMGTALKILFSLDPGSECPELQRNEVIALVNLLHRLSESLKANRDFTILLRSGASTAELPPPDAQATSSLPSFLL